MDAVTMFKVLVIEALRGRRSNTRCATGSPPRSRRNAGGAVQWRDCPRASTPRYARGYFALGGQIIDVSIVEAPKLQLQLAQTEAEDADAPWMIKRGRVQRCRRRQGRS